MKWTIPLTGKGTIHFVGCNEERNSTRKLLYPEIRSVARPGSSKSPCTNALYSRFCPTKWQFFKVGGSLLFIFSCHFFIFGRVVLQQMLFSKGPSMNVTVYLLKTKQTNTIIESGKGKFLSKSMKSNVQSRN